MPETEAQKWKRRAARQALEVILRYAKDNGVSKLGAKQAVDNVYDDTELIAELRLNGGKEARRLADYLEWQSGK